MEFLNTGFAIDTETSRHIRAFNELYNLHKLRIKNEKCFKKQNERKIKGIREVCSKTR